MTLIQEIRTTTVKRYGGYWFISLLVDISDTLPETKNLKDVESVVGIDVGVNKLVSNSDGSFLENQRFTTNKRTARRMSIRVRAASRKKDGSNNKRKAYQAESVKPFTARYKYRRLLKKRTNLAVRFKRFGTRRASQPYL